MPLWERKSIRTNPSGHRAGPRRLPFPRSCKPVARTDGNNVEFIEIYNSNPFFQDISGYKITCADMNYTFPPNTIMPGGAFFVVAASPSGIANVYGLTTNVFGPYTGSLKKSETLQLLDEQGSVLLTVPFNSANPWPVAAGYRGHRLFSPSRPMAKAIHARGTS